VPIANENLTFYQVPVPRGYWRFSRRKRMAVELSVGLACLIFFMLAVSMQTPVWLQITGWTCLLVYWAFWIVLYLRRWGQRQARARRLHL